MPAVSHVKAAEAHEDAAYAHRAAARCHQDGDTKGGRHNAEMAVKASETAQDCCTSASNKSKATAM